MVQCKRDYTSKPFQPAPYILALLLEQRQKLVLAVSDCTWSSQGMQLVALVVLHKVLHIPQYLHRTQVPSGTLKAQQ